MTLGPDWWLERYTRVHSVVSDRVLPDVRRTPICIVADDRFKVYMLTDGAHDVDISSKLITIFC